MTRGGLAVDLVSVKGKTRLQQFAVSEELWKWIDAHEKELGVGRPYRDRDPPHVGPIDGKEYIAKRGLPSVKKADCKQTREKGRIRKAEERVTVRRRIHDQFRTNIAASSRPVLGDKLLAEPLQQLYQHYTISRFTT